MPVKKKRAKKKAAPKKRAVRKAAPKKRAKKKAARRAAPKKRAAKKKAAPKRRAKKKAAPKRRAAKKKAAPKRRAKKKAAPKRRAKKKAAPKRRAKKKAARRAAPKKRAAKKKSPKKKVAQSVVSPRSPRIRRKTPKPKQKNNQSTQNIKRIDSEKTHGWQVHVCRNGVLRTKLFSDRVHGGKRVALSEAKRFRDQLRAEMTQNIAPTWKSDRSPKTNTGHLGVSYTETRRGNGDVKGYISVTARVSKGQPANRKFSIDKVGYDRALAHAVAWREEQLSRREQIERDHASQSLKR